MPTEFELIDTYFKPLGATGSFATTPGNLGIGDDCALLLPPAGQQLCITSDTLVAGRHFPLQTSPEDIGYKSLAVNLSDLAAMGAQPAAVLLALSLPAADPEWLAGFARGFASLCQSSQVALIGGDTTASPVLSITVTALGWVPAGQAIRRAGARPGDIIVVSGPVGSAAHALTCSDSRLLERLNRPRPRIELGLWLRKNGLVNAMLDISDGLAQDLQHILRASGVNGSLHIEAIPLEPELAVLPLETRMQLALNGGDDYELCFTCTSEQWQRICVSPHAATLHAVGTIGQASPQPVLQLLHHQQPWSFPVAGYQHF